MPKARSARGVLVDFDKIRIKQQLSATPTPIEVQKREELVEQRLKRRAKRRAEQAKVREAESNNNADEVSDTITENVGDENVIDEESPTDDSAAPVRKQKAKQKAKKKTKTSDENE